MHIFFIRTFLILSFVCCWSFNFFIGFPWPWVSFCVGSCRRRKWMWRPYFLDCFLPCGYRCDDDERVLPFFLLLFFFYLFLLFGRLRFHSRFLPLSGRRRRLLLLRSQVGRRWLLLAVNHNALIPESYGRRGRSRQLFCVCLLDGAGSVSLYSIAFWISPARAAAVCV